MPATDKSVADKSTAQSPSAEKSVMPIKPYCQSVLRIEVPVVVTLAHQKMHLEQILNLVPGVMLQFDKPCDSPMTLEVGDQPIAEGDIVKTGDRFGIRIGDILPPAERFVSVAPTVNK